MEGVIARQASALLTPRLTHVFSAAALPIGFVGVPDMVIASCFEQLYDLGTMDTPAGALHADILAYLRAVRGPVLLGTIALRVGRPEEEVEPMLRDLVSAGAVCEDGSLYLIAWVWRHILAEVLCVESVPGVGAAATVEGDVREVVDRAARNFAFAHRSFVALPGPAAEAVRREPGLSERMTANLVGLLSVCEDGTVTRAIDSPRRSPASWLPYYRLALTIARLPPSAASGGSG
jgi:hypothetical protein